jgi:RNA polymerase-binding transcription factor DksA
MTTCRTGYTEKELASIKMKLEARQRTLKRATSDYSKDIDVLSRSEISLDSNDYSLKCIIDEQRKKEIVQNELALKKIEKKTYGICSGCGKGINPERMKCYPNTTECQDCCKKRKNR